MSKRPTKLDEITVAMRQQYAHQHSATVVSKRNLLQYEVDQLDAKVIQLRAAIAATQKRANKLNAEILGLGLVLERR